MSEMIVQAVKQTCSCGCVYWLEQGFVKRLEESHNNWNCPACDLIWQFTGLNKAEKYKQKYQETKEKYNNCSLKYRQAINEKENVENDLRKEIEKLERDVEKYKNVMCPKCKKYYLLSDNERTNLICRYCKKSKVKKNQKQNKNGVS